MRTRFSHIEMVAQTSELECKCQQARLGEHLLCSEYIGYNLQPEYRMTRQKLDTQRRNNSNGAYELTRSLGVHDGKETLCGGSITTLLFRLYYKVVRLTHTKARLGYGAIIRMTVDNFGTAVYCTVRSIAS